MLWIRIAARDFRAWFSRQAQEMGILSESLCIKSTRVNKAPPPCSYDDLVASLALSRIWNDEKNTTGICFLVNVVCC